MPAHSTFVQPPFWLNWGGGDQQSKPVPRHFQWMAAARIGERDCPDRRGVRLAPHSSPGSFLCVLLRMDRVCRDAGRNALWRDAKHRVRDAHAPRNRPCQVILRTSKNRTGSSLFSVECHKQFGTVSRVSANPKGIESISPGLRGTSYPRSKTGPGRGREAGVSPHY